VHLQVVGRTDRPFGYLAQVQRRCPSNYWRVVREAHEELGLAVSAGPCCAWANVVPVKERDITVLSPTLLDGAVFTGVLLRTLMRHGTKNFSLAAILKPDGVVWRILDRGDPARPNADWGCMELFGSNVVATDPFVLHDLLRKAVSGPSTP